MRFTVTVLVACKSNPCTNGGVCTITAHGYKCACKNHTFGRNCEREFLFYCSDTKQLFISITYILFKTSQ